MWKKRYEFNHYLLLICSTAISNGESAFSSIPPMRFCVLFLDLGLEILQYITISYVPNVYVNDNSLIYISHYTGNNVLCE
jgi:hypothetical protein